MRDNRNGMFWGLLVFTLVVSVSPGVIAQELDIPTLVLERSVHFLTSDESDRIVEPGVYGVTGNAQASVVTLLPINGSDPIDIQAEVGTYQEVIPSAEVHSLSIDENEFHVVLLSPEGQTLEAVGSPSGIRSRAGKSRVATKLFGSKVLRSNRLFPNIQVTKPAVTSRKKIPRSKQQPTIKMTVTGTGKLAAIGAFKPVVLSTEKFTVTGTGRLGVGGAFSPMQIRVNGMRVAGTGRLR